MGNLLCCYNDDTSSVESLQRSLVVNNAPVQRTVCDTTVPIYREANATITNIPPSETVPPGGNINPLQRNLQTKLQSRKAASLMTIQNVNIIDSEPTFSHAKKVAPRTPEKQACKACGEIGHLTKSCRYFTRLCFHCREEGHINRICPKRKRHGTKQKENRTQRNGTYHATAREQKDKLVQKKNRTKVQKRPRRVNV